MINKLRIATRASNLALKQTELVIKKLKSVAPDIEFEIIPVITQGDKIQNKSLIDIGGKDLFVKDIEQLLIDEKVDIAVHSAKDVPIMMHKNLTIGGVLKRDYFEDVLITKNDSYCSLSSLPSGSVIGSTAPRREQQVKFFRDDLKIMCIRGNVETRIKKLVDINGEFDAIILALAGIKRLNLNVKYHIIENMVPAAGQGIICMQCNFSNEYILKLLSYISHKQTEILLLTERLFVQEMEGDCSTPIGVLANIVNNEFIEINFMYGNENVVYAESTKCNIQNYENAVIKIAKKIKSYINKI